MRSTTSYLVITGIHGILVVSECCKRRHIPIYWPVVVIWLDRLWYMRSVRDHREIWSLCQTFEYPLSRTFYFTLVGSCSIITYDMQLSLWLIGTVLLFLAKCIHITVSVFIKFKGMRSEICLNYQLLNLILKCAELPSVFRQIYVYQICV